MNLLKFLNVLSLFAALSISHFCLAQTMGQNTYISAVDQDLAIKTVTLIPPTDNVGGIYANPIGQQLQVLLDKDRQWSFAKYPENLTIKSESLDDKPEDVKKIFEANKTDAALSCLIVKGTKGISITLTLFVGRDGYPLLQESVNEFKGYEISEVREQVQKLFENIKFRMPFRGNIISRRGQQVTINLGSSYGLKQNSRVSVVQIIKINRHPKLKLMVGTEKEVLGRVKLFKVEPHLSFGAIEMEKEPGVITVGSKVMPDEFVKYELPVVTRSGRILQEFDTRADKAVAFGEEPTEWIPEAQPQFGQLEILGGLSAYKQNAKLSSSSITGSNNLAPNILVRGELWLNPDWNLEVHFRQSVFAINNTLSGSAPSSLNMSLGQYGVGASYNVLLTDNYFGPKLQVGADIQNTNFIIDDSSPLAYTTMKYGGLALHLGALVPISDEVPLEIGGSLKSYLSSSLSENQKSGSSSSSQINQFRFFGDYKIKTRYKIHGEILFENFSSNFSGGTLHATTISHDLMTLWGGVQFQF